LEAGNLSFAHAQNFLPFLTSKGQASCFNRFFYSLVLNCWHIKKSVKNLDIPPAQRQLLMLIRKEEKP
jgi:hypothetical protein